MSVMECANYNLDKFSPEILKNIIQVLNEEKISVTKLKARKCKDLSLEEQMIFLSKWQKSPLEWKLDGMIEMCKKIGLYPVWNMPGHRNTYYFPTEIECEIWQDWLDSMREDG